MIACHQGIKKDLKLLMLNQVSEILNCHPNTLRAWDEKAIWLLYGLAHAEIDDTAEKM